jgi:hypothetical protein
LGKLGYFFPLEVRMSLLHRVAVAGLVALSAPVSAKDERVMVEPGSVTRVAIVNRVPEGLNYTHRAMTMFGNEGRVLAVDWNPSQMIEAALETALREGGIESSSVSLSEEDEAPAFGKPCWSGWSSKYKPKCQPALDALLDRLNVDLLIVLRPYTIKDYYYASPVMVTGIGVHTSGAGEEIKQSVVVSHVAYEQYSRKGPLHGSLCLSTPIDAERTFTATPNTLGVDDVAWVQADLQRLVSENAVRTLRGSGVLPGGFERCPLGWGRP